MYKRKNSKFDNNNFDIEELFGEFENLEPVISGQTEMYEEEPTCKICKKKASKLDYYIDQAKEEKTTAAAIARSDGTYNYMTNEFYCMTCYVIMGCPLGTA
jgi:hypothetical protein